MKRVIPIRAAIVSLYSAALLSAACGGQDSAVNDPMSPGPDTSTGDTDTSDTSPQSDTTPEYADAGDVLKSYGELTTIAGACTVSDKGVNGWQAAFEGGPAIQAELSRPHFAMADSAGNIFVADKDAQAVRKITPDGTITTAAGTGVIGDGSDGPAPGTETALASPNGLWVHRDGTVYILDLENSKVRKLDTEGVMTTLFTSTITFSLGRGLWVSDAEDLVYVASGSQVLRWRPETGVDVYADGFLGLANLVVDPQGFLVVTDRTANRVYRIDAGGEAVPIAGNGTVSGGGAGMPALDTGLGGVRGVWFIDDGSYFLATHEGNQVWYVDTKGIIHLFLDGAAGAHSGDGEPHDTPGLKVSEARAISVDFGGNVLVTEHDCGYIRKVAYQNNP